MLNGVLVVESLRLGTRLDLPDLTVRRISHVVAESATRKQPHTWSLIDFCGPDDSANELAELLAEALEPDGHWYADFGVDDQHVVVFPGKIFRYEVGDVAGRADAERYGASIGIPVEQLDWAD